MNAKAAVLWLVMFLVLSPGASAETQGQKVASLIASMETSDMSGKIAVEKLVKIGRPAADQLLEALKHKTPRVRYWSAAAIARIGDERCVKPLIDLVKKDKHGIVRATALYYLRLFPHKEVWELMMETLDHPSFGMRGWAIRALREKNRKEAVPKLKKLMKHANYKTRYDAMVAVATLSDGDVSELLRGVLKTDRSKDVRIGAMKCLTIRTKKRPVILTVMIDGLEDRDLDVRTAAAQLLRRGTNQEFPFFPNGDPEDRSAAVRNWRRWYEKHKDRLYWNTKKRCFEIGGRSK